MNLSDNKPKILLGLTTTHGSNWRDKIEEIKSLKLEEIALFPTVLEKNERQELYKTLEETDLKSIPHVHARHDFTDAEFKYLQERWSTKLFNVHFDYFDFETLKASAFKSQIYIENTGILDERFENFLEESAGVCLDFSHYFDYWILQKRPDYKICDSLLKKFQIGCCHISAISDKKKLADYGENDKWHYSRHTYNDLTEFDYLKTMKQFLPEIISLELENSLTEQLEVKEYIENNILGEV